jgi:hypothetical protein
LSLEAGSPSENRDLNAKTPEFLFSLEGKSSCRYPGCDYSVPLLTLKNAKQDISVFAVSDDRGKIYIE